MDKTKVFEIIDDARKLGAVEIRLSEEEITVFYQYHSIPCFPFTNSFL